jgi:hypothetical protein
MMHGPSGTGGWLGFFILVLTAIGPLIGASQKYQMFSMAEFNTPQLASYAPYLSYRTASWAIFIAGAIISATAGFMLYLHKHPASVRFAIVSLWLIFPVRQILYIVAAQSIFNEQAASVLTQDGTSWLISSAIAAGIGTAYLLISKRVQNTYYN